MGLLRTMIMRPKAAANRVSKAEIANRVSNSPRLRTAFNKFSGLPAESGIANPEERRLILYTSAKEVADGILHYAQLGVRLNHVCIFHDRPLESEITGLPALIKEADLAFYPDHEVLVFRNVDSMFAEAGLCFRLACLGINQVTRSNYRLDQRASPVFAYPSIMRDRIDDIERLFNLMANEQSRNDLAAYIKGRSLPSIGYHRIADFKEYYHPECKVSAGDVVIDAGLLDGMTSVEFGKAAGPTGIVYGFEPSPHAWDKIESNFAKHPDLSLNLVKEGVWSEDGEVKFVGTRIVDDLTALSPQEAQQVVPVKVGTIDRFIADKPVEKLDFLKMDVEGAEMAALSGSVETIKKHRPKLAICVYHKLNDIFDIPFFLDDLDCGYRFYFATHSIGATSVVLYATPDRR